MPVYRIPSWPRFSPLLADPEGDRRFKNIVEGLGRQGVDLEALQKILVHVREEYAKHRDAHATLSEKKSRVWRRQRRETIPHAAEKLEILIRDHLRHLDERLKDALRYTASLDNPFSTGPRQPVHPVLEKVLGTIELLKTDPIFQPRSPRPTHRPECPAIHQAETELRGLKIPKETALELLRLVGVKN